MAAQVRVTQVAAEVLVLPIPQVRVTQVAAEVLVGALEANVRVTQLAIEALITNPTGTTTCADPWTFPEPNPFPFPAIGGPQYLYLEELTTDWGEYGQEAPDGVPEWGTIQTSAVRRFAIEYNGLSIAEARILDAHYESTRGGIAFSLTMPRSSEAISNVRYEEYKVNPHRVIWSQSRSITLVKFTN